MWLAQLAKTGDYQAKPNQPRGNGHKITDWERFKEFVRANGDKTQEEMAKLWEVSISDRTISRALKKIGFSRKSGCNRAEVSSACVAPSKKLMGVEKGMKKEEENLGRS